ncbi:glycosyltransferase family 4 protein [Thermodesulfobacteriota bacterium]
MTLDKNRQIIINATNIGKKPSGIGLTTLSILSGLAKLKTDIEFLVFLNQNAKEHIATIDFPTNFKLHWTSYAISPDYGTTGHIRRLLYSNYLSFKFRGRYVFNTSQLEAALFKKRQILAVHDVIALVVKNDEKRSEQLFYKHYLKSALNSSEQIIVPSKHTGDLLSSIYNIPAEKIHVIHHGLNDMFKDEAKNINAQKENFILYAGRISPTKNITRILKAFDLIRDKVDHKLLFIGGEDHNKLLPENDDRIIVKGYVSNEELLNHYKTAALFIFPSLYEGFGLPPLEAMACSCPTVVSNVASIPEVCSDAAFYVDPLSVDSIADGMLKVLTDNTLRNEMINNGIKRVGDFSWEKASKTYLEIFERILG